MKKIISAILFCAVATAATAQTLNNGITLPKIWPPQYEEPTVRQEMPVPYLKNKPAVLPINNGRQLFVDSFLISSTNLRSIYHAPNFYKGNPVLEPTENGKTQQRVLLMQHHSVTVSGMTKRKASSRCGILQEQEPCTSRATRLSIPAMLNQRMVRTGRR